MLGLAQTGTGKTAAFALPIIDRLITRTGSNNPRCLIIAPTRELAIQIHAEIELLAKYTNVRSTTVFGGVGANPQIRALRSRPDIVVACPGRLLDRASSRDARLDGIEVLVLDEADHMLDMGFLPDIKRIIKLLPQRRQNLLFSATMPREIRGLANSLLRDPHIVELAHSAPAETIDHALYPVEQKRKTALLKHLMDDEDFTSAIVFLRTKHRAKRLARDLDAAGHNAVALQGNMSQSQRQKAMQGFRDGRFDVLVATDIAARGIDVANVSHVVNFDIPCTPDAYTHRIGRTGRAERSGKAYTFITHEDTALVRAIERKLKMEIPRVKVRDFVGEDDDFRRGRGGPPRRAGGGRKFAGRGAGAAKQGRGKARPKSGASARPYRSTATTSSAPAAADGPSFGSGLEGQSRSTGSNQTKRARRRKRIKNSGSGSGSSTSSGSSFGQGVGGGKRRSRNRPAGGGSHTRGHSGHR